MKKTSFLYLFRFISSNGSNPKTSKFNFMFNPSVDILGELKGFYVICFSQTKAIRAYYFSLNLYFAHLRSARILIQREI